MYTEVASKLAVADSGTEYSQAVSMAGGNAVAVELTVFVGQVAVTVEVGNDLENWAAGPALDPTMGSAGIGYHFGDTTASIASQYVRLKYVGAADSVIAAGINVANL